MKFVNLYVQSEYAMLSSSISLKDLFDFCTREKIMAVGIADSFFHGAYKFYRGAQHYHIKPIIGLRVVLNTEKTNSLLVYAKNYQGYQALMRLATQQSTDQMISINQIALYQEHLIIIVPSDEHELVRALRDEREDGANNLLHQLQQAFSTLYIGLDQQTIAMRQAFPLIVSWFQRHKTPMVALHRTNYLLKDDFPVYTTLRAIDLGVTSYLNTEKEAAMYFPSETDINALYHDYPELITNTNLIADECSVQIPTGQYLFPSYGIENSKEYLETLCKVGLNKRLQHRRVDVERYRERLLYELSIIDKMGYNDYFLIVYDYVKYAKQNGILVGTGRGSAPGSLVIYSLGITEIDPLEYDLLFERFLNPDRISMPDIDVDFPDDRREEVIQYVASRFGLDQVAYITTFGTFGARMAIRDVARVMQIADQRVQLILKPVQDHPQPLAELITSCQEVRQMMESNEDIHRLYTLASKLEGLPRHTSTHAAGIIMAKGELVAYTPLQKGLGGLWQTQYEAGDLEALGLVKMDILGLRNLTIIKNVLDLIKEHTGVELRINQLPLQDAAVYRMIATGETDGIFQLESRGMRKLLADLKCSSFMDIVNANALFRPGPMDMIQTFVRRKFGETVVYPHEDLKAILAPTYGTIVFQEQIIMIAQRFAGYTLGMADLLRRAVSKKDHVILENERTRFVASAIKQGYTEALSNEIYDYIVKFANYGFNKSHSVAYAMIAYQMAYLKVHYYDYFMSVLMTNSVGSPQAIQTYINDCRRHQLMVLPPSINQSTTCFEVTSQGLYYPLNGISNLGTTIASDIIAERMNGLYRDYDEFIRRTATFLNKRHVANLIYAGAFDEFGLTRKHMIENYDDAMRRKDYAETLGSRILSRPVVKEEYAFDEISVLEKEALGMNLKYNLLIKYQQLKQEKKTTNIDTLQVGQKVRVLFVIRTIKQIQTKNQENMAFLEIYDDTASCEAVIFPRDLRNMTTTLDGGLVYLGQGQVTKRNDRLQVVLESVYNVK